MSVFYEGVVRHRRHVPVAHEFEYRVAMVLRPSPRAGELRAATGTEGRVLELRTRRGFDPIVVHYCHDAGDRVAAVVAEVTNTPWGERHDYVLPADGADGIAKAFHVSPFMGMGQTYDFRVSAPGESLAVHIRSTEDGERAFDATLELRRAQRGRAGLAALPMRTSALIYWNALRLWRKGAPYSAHPHGRPWHSRLTGAVR